MVRVNPLQRREIVRLGQKIVVNAHFHLAADLEIRVQEHIERMADNTLGGIFYRHNAEISLSSLHLIKHGFNGRMPQGLYRVPEMPVHRLLGKGAFRSEVGNLHGFLPGQAGRHDLPEQAQHFGITQRTLITLQYAA